MNPKHTILLEVFLSIPIFTKAGREIPACFYLLGKILTCMTWGSNSHGNGHTDPMSEAFLQMAGVFSQLELAMIRARVRSGMENARAKGCQIGRPQVSKEDIPATFLRHYPAYKSKQLNVSELARVCDISRTTAYKYIGLLEA